MEGETSIEFSNILRALWRDLYDPLLNKSFAVKRNFYILCRQYERCI